MIESGLQKKCAQYANKFRVLVRKVHVEGRRGWPDLLLIFPETGETVYVEMKHPDGTGKLGELQKIEREKIQRQGASAYVCDSYHYFRLIVRKHHVNLLTPEEIS